MTHPPTRVPTRWVTASVCRRNLRMVEPCADYGLSVPPAPWSCTREGPSPSKDLLEPKRTSDCSPRRRDQAYNPPMGFFSRRKPTASQENAASSSRASDWASSIVEPDRQRHEAQRLLADAKRLELTIGTAIGNQARPPRSGAGHHYAVDRGLGSWLRSRECC